MKSEVTIPVRLSHLLRHCSVGAVVRGDEYMVVVKDTRQWHPDGREPSELRYVDQVRSMLGISERLCTPPIANLTDDGEIEGNWIPAMLFPQWMFCPSRSCGQLYYQPWKKNRDASEWYCHHRSETQCRQPLEQVAWVLVHKEGYLADSPWHRIAHANSRPRGEICYADWDKPYLRLITGDSRTEVACDRCNARGEIFPRIPFPKNTWKQPWLNEVLSEPPEEWAWIVSISDVRVHGAITGTALVIPPESRIHKGSVVDRLYCNSSWRRDLEKARPGLQRRKAVKRIAQHCRCTDKEVEEAEQELATGYPLYGQTLYDGNILQGEYQALIHPVLNLSEDEDFVTEHHTQAWKSMQYDLSGRPRQVVEAVDRLIEVRRLKEIMVLRAFNRLNAEPKHFVRPDITGETDWLPALELRGEGIFFTLDESILAQWEKQEILQKRAGELDRRVAATHVAGLETAVSPRYLLLHTLAHLLIRQFETEAGYPAASLKERIYCESGDAPHMAGILIYVAVPDEVGSLGGLGELAAPGRFLRFLTSAFKEATWCSLDPVCVEHSGQGPHQLNRAACHACVLIPEPSCLHGNVILDRTFVKGDSQRNIRSFLDYTGENM